MGDNGHVKGNNEIEKGQTTSSEEDATAEHPTGFRLAMVIVALVLSVFIVALDMVSSFFSTFYFFQKAK